jgi:hypothetical protein
VVNDLWVARSEVPMFPLRIVGFLKTPQEYLLSLWISQVHRLTKLFPFTAVHCFSTLCTNINLSDLKARIKVLVSKVINRMLSRCFKFLLGQKSALNLRCVWLKNTGTKVEGVCTNWMILDLNLSCYHFWALICRTREHQRLFWRQWAGQ